MISAAPAASAVAPVAPPIAPPAGRAPQRTQGDDFGLPEPVEPVRPPPRAPVPAVEEAPAPPARAGWRPPRPAADRTPPKPAARPSAADNPFDSAWPDKPAASSARREPAIDIPPEPVASGGRQEAATVLKSGVVDGMAYTLYTDGSIEAELAARRGSVRIDRGIAQPPRKERLIRTSIPVRDAGGWFARGTFARSKKVIPLWLDLLHSVGIKSYRGTNGSSCD